MAVLIYLTFSRGDVDSSAQQILLSKVAKQLSSACAHDCEGLLTVAECFSALQGMAWGKAPGLDGFPIKFNLCFWDILG